MRLQRTRALALSSFNRRLLLLLLLVLFGSRMTMRLALLFVLFLLITGATTAAACPWSRFFGLQADCLQRWNLRSTAAAVRFSFCRRRGRSLLRVAVCLWRFVPLHWNKIFALDELLSRPPGCQAKMRIGTTGLLGVVLDPPKIRFCCRHLLLRILVVVQIISSTHDDFRKRASILAFLAH
jgi:hypothetical protein